MAEDKTEALLAERGQVYGDAVRTHARIAQVWSGILDTEVTAQQVALCMVGLKLVRASCAPEHEDSYADMHGYTTIAERISVEQPVPFVPSVVSDRAATCDHDVPLGYYCWRCNRDREQRERREHGDL